MKKNFKLIFLIVLCITFFTSIMCGSLYYSSQRELQALEEEINSIITNSYFPNSPLYSYTKDSNFKLFWGKWKVTKVIGECVFDNQACEWNISFEINRDPEISIGTIYEFTDSNININGEKITEKIMYDYYVIPEGDFSSKDMFLMEYPEPEDLGLSGEFFLLIKAVSKESQSYCISFFVKDSDTLILISNDVCYEMTRS